MRPFGRSAPGKIGQYRLIAELGSGGMGRVLLGCAPDGRLVALKQVHPQLAQDDDFRARFRREVEASRRVSGAYSAAVIDADVTAPTPWLASVFVPGPSLREVMDTVGRLPEESVCRLAAGLATALIEIHRAGLVHRDLKPSNVLLAEDGPRLIDFGIARATDLGGGELTGTGGLVGSPGYMSPEQVRGEPVTPASDVFCLGAVLFAACTTEDAFKGTSAIQALHKVAHTEPDLTAVPERLREIIGWCLAKDPAERATPVQVLERLGEIPLSPQAWPPAVQQLIARQQTDLHRFLDEMGERTFLLEADPPAIVGRTRVDTGLPPAPAAPARKTTRQHFTILAAIITVVAVALTAALLLSRHWAGTDTAAGAPKSLAPAIATQPAGTASSFTTSVLPDYLPPGYGLCATEGQSCASPGPHVMAFGAGVYYYKLVNGPTPCSNDTFGRDPASGVFKSCFLAPSGGPSGYAYCALEGGTCAVDGTREVAYGANGAFHFKFVNGSVSCTGSEFEFNAPDGVPSGCYVAPDRPPGNWTQCAVENGTCDLSGEQPLVFGSNGAYWPVRSEGSTHCSVDTIGVDPLPGSLKKCYAWTGPPSGYPTECASENGTCSFDGKATIAFGANGNYVYQTFENGVPCTDEAFGTDPLPGAKKTCYRN